MGSHATAALRATLVTGLGCALMLVPVINALILIFVMLPLWVASDLGVPGLGHPLNGFFVPSAIGWCVVAGVFWGVTYVLALGAARSASGR